MKSVIYITGWMLVLQACLMGLPAVTALVYGETSGFAFLITMVLCGALGFALTWSRPRRISFSARDGLVTTAIGWMVMSVTGALPFLFSGEISGVTDAIFETVSGFTTTGTSIVPNPEVLSHCVNMWRCFTHWIGGMGVLVFLLAVLPMVSGGSNMQLMKAESPGPSVGKLVPKVRFTAQMLYFLYVGMTLLEVVLLLLGGTGLFDALCISFATAGTGGFGTRQDSLASFSPYVQWVVTAFMIFFGVNFNVYYLLFLRKIREALHCEEMRWYLGIIGVATLLIFGNTFSRLLSVEHNLRNAAFQVASIITTTGFSTTAFDAWPSLSRLLLVLLMFIGACAGSTGGGTKVVRVVCMTKQFGVYMGSFLHPRAVRKIKFEGKVLESDTLRAIQVYYVGVVGIVTLSVLLISLENRDLVTTFTAVAATFNNIGPGLAEASGSFESFTLLSKWVMIFDMLAGRLEIFPMLLMFHPRLWKEGFSEIRVLAKRKRLINGRT